MTEPRCAVVGCGRTHGVLRDMETCWYHRADYAAGVELELRTGWTLYQDICGNAQIRPGRAKMDETQRDGAAMLQTSDAVTNHR